MVLKYVHICLFAVGIWANAYCQNDALDYHFLNQAISQLPKIGNCDFILIDKAQSTRLDDKQHSISSRLKELKNVIDSSTLKEIIYNSSKNNTQTIPLSKSQINKVQSAHLMTTESADTFFNKGVKQPYCSPFKYYLYIPVFDNKREYAVIDWAYTQHFHIEYGAAYLFKKINGNWILQGAFDNYEY